MTEDKMKVVITGITGFLGAALARRLAAEDVDLHGVARPSADRSRVADLPIQWHSADVTHAASLHGVFDGAQWVVHAAGMLGQSGTSEARYQEVNALGTQNVLDAVAAGGSGARVLYIGSVGVLGPIIDGNAAQIIDETARLAPSNAYERSKATAELIARSYAVSGLPVIIMRPEFVYGPGDTHVLGLFRAVQRGLFFYIGDGSNTCHPTYIDDAVEGMWLCMRRGVPGEIYQIVGPNPVTFRHLAETIAREASVAPPRLALPRRLVLAGVSAAETVASPLGMQIPLSSSGATFFSENRRSTYAKARRELGYQPQTVLQSGVRRTIAWYRQSGLLE